MGRRVSKIVGESEIFYACIIHVKILSCSNSQKKGRKVPQSSDNNEKSLKSILS